MGIKNFIKTNTPVNKIVSSIVPSSNDFLKSTNKALGRQEKNLSVASKNLAESINGGVLKGDKLKQARLLQEEMISKKSVLGSVKDEVTNSMDKGLSRRDALKAYYGATKEDGKIKSTVSLAKDMLSVKTENVNPYKLGVGAAAIGGGVGLTSRYRNGGTLTTNEYGEKDIAGLPFI